MLFPLTEEDESDSTNEESDSEDAKEFDHPNQEIDMADAFEEDADDDVVDHQGAVILQQDTYTPPGSPPPDLKAQLVEILGVEMKSSPKLQPTIPQIHVLRDSATQTPQDGTSTPARSVVPQLIDPDDDVLSDSDVPGPWIEDYAPPPLSECEDRADYLLKKRFKPMIDPQTLIAALTKFKASERSTENLYLLAANAQRILKAWQDEYLLLDAHVCIGSLMWMIRLLTRDRRRHIRILPRSLPMAGAFLWLMIFTRT